MAVFLLLVSDLTVSFDSSNVKRSGNEAAYVNQPGGNQLCQEAVRARGQVELGKGLLPRKFKNVGLLEIQMVRATAKCLAWPSKPGIHMT